MFQESNKPKTATPSKASGKAPSLPAKVKVVFRTKDGKRVKRK